MIRRLRDTLVLAREESGKKFCGLGVIVYEHLEHIPVFPLRTSTPLPMATGLAEALASVSSSDSEFHDGFHLISQEWRLTHVAQYFSPPIVPHARMHRPFGGRYLAALFGSALPGVLLTGALSSNGGLALFKNSLEVHFEWLP